MKRTLCVVSCAALVLAVMSGAALAAQITYVSPDTTTGPNGWSGIYGSAQAVFWDISSGRPNYNSAPTNTGGSANPNYVQSFTYQNTTVGGGSTGIGGGNSTAPNGYGGGAGTNGISYNLVMNQNMNFNFTALFYDATYGADNGGLDAGATALEVRLVDPVAGTDEAWHAISVAQLQAGIFETWAVKANAGDSISTEVDWVNGQGVGAAGFFLDSVVPTAGVGAPPLTPEPATTGLLGLGLASLLTWRKKRFGSAKEDRRASDFSRLADI